MSAGDAPTINENADPFEVGQGVFEWAVSALDDCPEDDPIEQTRIETQVINEYVDGMAAAIRMGFDRSAARRLTGNIADEIRNATKTDIQDDIRNAINEATLGEDTGQPLDAFIEQSLKTLTALKTTDSNRDTTYRWEFDDGEHDPFVIETGDGASTAHGQWQSMGDAVLDQIQVATAPPVDELRGGSEWRQFISRVIEEHATQTLTIGPRTVAVEGLQRRVSQHVAYGDVQDMFERDGVMLDGHPEAEDDSDRPTELRIPSTMVRRTVEDTGVTHRGIQSELTARGYTVDHVNGVSQETTINGAPFSWWVVTPDFAEPLKYVPDPMSEEERFESSLADDGIGGSGNRAANPSRADPNAGGDYR